MDDADNPTHPPADLEPEGAHEAAAEIPGAPDGAIVLPPAPCIVETRTYTRLSDGATITWRGIVSGDAPPDFVPFIIATVLQLADDRGQVFHAHPFTVPLKANDLDGAFVEYADALKVATQAEYQRTMRELNAPRLLRPDVVKHRAVPGSRGG
jgi:hypothetical protein